MKLVETSVTETAVRMRFADTPDAAKAKAWVDFQVPMAELTVLSGSPLGDPNTRRFSLVRLAALRHARSVIAQEMKALEGLANASPE